MNITNSLMKMVVSRAFALKNYPIVSVVALILLVAGAPSPVVGPLVASSATIIAVAPRIPTRQAVVYRYAASILIMRQCLTAERFLSAGIVTADWSGRNGGSVSDVGFDFLVPTPGGKRMDNRDVLSDLDKKILAGKRLGVFDDFEGRQLLKCYDKGIRDSFVVGRIEQRVDKRLRRLALADSPFLPARLNRGDFVFGIDQWNNKLLTYVQFFNAHTLIVANTGAGKSNLSLYHAAQIAVAANLRGIWLIDIRKSEYRSVRPVLARLDIDLKIIRGRKFRINPLQVPYGVDPIEYATVAADFLVRALNLPPRASTLLRSTLIKLYRQHGVLEGGQVYPTLYHLFEVVKTDRNANPQARTAILDNLQAILLALGPEILAYHRGWDVHELARQYLVMELGGLPEAGKDLILSYLMTAEFLSRISRGISNPGMDLWISFDECQRLFSQRKETASYGGNPLIDLTGLVRGTGIGLEISVLTTNDLSTNVPNLTSTKIIGRCGSMAEYTAAGHLIGLNTEQIMWCAHHMVPGLFVGQLGEGGWRYPFLFRVPLLNVGRSKSEDGQAGDCGDLTKVGGGNMLPAKIQ